MAAEETTGVKYVIEVDTSGLDKLNGKLQQAGAEGQRQIGDKLTKAGSQASTSMGKFGESTDKLRYLLGSMGSEIGGVAGKVVGFGSAFVGSTMSMGIWTTAIAAGVAGLGVLYEKFSDRAALARFAEGLKETGEKIVELRNKIWDLQEAAIMGPNAGPATKAAREAQFALAEAMARDYEIQTKYQEYLESGTRDVSDTRYQQTVESTKKVAELQKKAGEAEVLALEEREKNQTDANNKILQGTISLGQEKLAAQKAANDKLAEESKRSSAELLEFDKNLRDEQLGISLEYARIRSMHLAADTEWEATKKKQADDLRNEGREILMEGYEDYNKTSKEITDREKDEAKRRNSATMQWMGVVQAGMGASIQVASMFDLFGEKSAKNEEERARAVGMRLGFENTINAATEIAMAAASAATQNYPGAVMHGIAAALHTAAAIKCYADPTSAGGFSPPSASGGAASRGAAMARDLEDKNKSMTEKGGGVVINIYGNQINAEGADKVFANGVERWAKKQRPGRPTGRL